jgi:hypothetical protein
MKLMTGVEVTENIRLDRFAGQAFGALTSGISGISARVAPAEHVLGIYFHLSPRHTSRVLLQNW